MSYLLYIALLPVVILLGFIYKKDVDKEPRGLLIKILIFGALSVIPIVIGELILGMFFPSSNLPTFAGTFVTIFLTVALIEEIGKWVVVYFGTYRKKEFNHSYDGVVYAVFSSLGFALVENVLYVLQSGFGTGILRALLAVPGHAVDAVFMGYFLSKSKEALVNNDNSKSLSNLIMSIVAPTISHAIYDALIFHYVACEEFIYIVLFFGFVITSYVLAFIIVSKLSKKMVNFDGTQVVLQQAVRQPINSFNQPVQQQVIPQNNIQLNTKCRNCGAPLTGEVCNYCGFKQQ